jgi:hypothetical protein
MEEENKKEEVKTPNAGKKIDLPEMFLITPLLIFLDIMDLIKTLLEGTAFLYPISLFLGALSFIATALIQFYLFIKGAKSLYFLVGGVLDSLLPLVSFLPLKTVGWLITVYIFNKQQK